MSKTEQRLAYDRGGLCDPSDLTDADWALIAPFVSSARCGGRRRELDVREEVNAIFSVLSVGC